MDAQRPRKLKMLGMLLFLIGLLTGLVIMNLKNPRMGLSAHLEGVMNGTFLVVAGLIWNDLRISDKLKNVLFATVLYGTFANWVIIFASAILGTSRMTPIAGKGFEGTPLHEMIIAGGLVSIALTMVFSLAVMVYGLRGSKD